MKIRNGFVSNSSSSSFCMACVSSSQFGGSACKKRLCELDYKRHGDLTIITGYDEVYIGIDIDKMMGDETRDEFIDRAFKEITAFGVDNEIPELQNFNKTKVSIFMETVEN